MAYAKKTPKANEAFQTLKNDLAAGRAQNAYIFYGEETYLREYYLKELRKKLIPAGFEEFNYHTLEGKDLTVQTLAETAEAMPMMAERTLIVVSDFDLFKLNEDQRERLIAFLEDIPPYCCVVFLYDTVDYKPNRTMKKLYKAVTDHVQVVEFRPADNSDLVVWIARRFKALGKEIDRQTAEYLIFTCGGLMTGALADTWEPDEFNALMTDNVGSIDENTTPEELDEIIDKLSNAEIVLPEEGDGLTGSMTAGSYGGSINQLFAELQKKLAEEAKSTAQDRIESIRAQQEEQSRASGYISDLRGLRLKLADDEMTCAMPDEIVAYMQEKSIALPEDPSAVNREQLEAATIRLENYMEYLGTDISYSTTYVQDYVSLYNSYTTGATSAIEAANKTLSDLMMSGTMLGSGLGMTVTALIVGLAVGAGVTALVLKKKSSKAS